MKAIVSIVLFLMSLTAAQGQPPTPSVALVGQIRCGLDSFAVLEVSNRSIDKSVFLPLSPLYQAGYTIHDIRIEVKQKGQWHYLERGADLPASGVRELKPGERFFDRILLYSGNNADTLLRFPLRLQVPYIVGTSSGTVKTMEFNLRDLLLKKNFACPGKLNNR